MKISRRQKFAVFLTAIGLAPIIFAAFFALKADATLFFGALMFGVLSIMLGFWLK